MEIINNFLLCCFSNISAISSLQMGLAPSLVRGAGLDVGPQYRVSIPQNCSAHSGSKTGWMSVPASEMSWHPFYRFVMLIVFIFSMF